MSVFTYKARDKNGSLIQGMVDANSEEMVANLLTEKNFTIVAIEKRKSDAWHPDLLSIFKRVGTKDLVVFFRQLAVMIDANMPVVKALRILIRQTHNKNLKMVIAGLADEVEGGNSLSSGMSVFPEVFTPFYVNIIKSGETSGRLSQVMDYLADQKEKDYDLESNLKGAMIYPAFILSALVIVGFVVMTFVVPKMTAMIVESGAEMPFITQVLIGVSSFLANFWWLVIIVVIILAFGISVFLRTENGKRLLDLVKIRLPIFGNIFKYIYVVRICRSLGTLLKGGVPISRGLEVVRDVVGNKVYFDILSATIKEVSEGNSIAEAFSASKDIPVMVYQMIGVGEEIGKLEEILDKVSEFYSREINNSVKNLASLIEPLIMVFLGLAVGLFVAAIILPMWQLSSSM